MARKQGNGFAGSPRIRSFLTGFRWLSLILCLIFIYIDNSRLSPSWGPFQGLGWAVALGLCVYHLFASVILMRVIEQPIMLYLLVGLDIATGAVVTWLCGMDGILLACGLPVIETAYLGGATAALFITFLVGMIDGFIIFQQMIELIRNQARLTNITPSEVNAVRLYDLVGFTMVELLLVWAMAAVRGEQEELPAIPGEHGA